MDDLTTSGETVLGLTSAEAAARLARHGSNALPEKGSRGTLAFILATLREPLFLLLVAAAALYLVLGDLGEGLFLSVGAAVPAGLVVYQEARSESALAALKEMAEPFARVVRDGVEGRVPVRELVPGDVVLVGEGERIPADAVLIGGDALTIDESALTGESVPVAKRLVNSSSDGGSTLSPEARTRLTCSRARSLCAGRAWHALCELGRRHDSAASASRSPRSSPSRRSCSRTRPASSSSSA